MLLAMAKRSDGVKSPTRDATGTGTGRERLRAGLVDVAQTQRWGGL